jgi:hypothetical protein
MSERSIKQRVKNNGFIITWVQVIELFVKKPNNLYG